MSVECTFNIGYAVISLAGIALGGIVGFLSARHISKQNAFTVAATQLRATVAPSLMHLSLARINMSDSGDIHLTKTLDEELPKIAVVIEEFRPFVKNSANGAYQVAWEQYYKAIKGGGVATLRAYNEDDPWSVVENKIQAILAFAKPR